MSPFQEVHMRIFLTGATGFIGSAIVQELLQAGHRVTGLARTDAAAKSLAVAGAQAYRGDVEDLESLRRGASESDGVIHTAFNHDFSRLKESCQNDRRAIEALGAALLGSSRPLVITSGTALLTPGKLATETERHTPGPEAFPRVASEEAADSVASKGVRVATVRLAPSVHGDGDHAFVPALIHVARAKGESAYVGDGANRWATVHRLDAASLFRLVVESDFPAASRFHGIGEQGVLFRDIAEVIGRHLNVPVVSQTPERAAEHFGFFAPFVALDAPASSQTTREALGWRPTQPGLIADLEGGRYFGT
jgi:nucleoside-diphosphate-sugar epimerase